MKNEIDEGDAKQVGRKGKDMLIEVLLGDGGRVRGSASHKVVETWRVGHRLDWRMRGSTERGVLALSGGVDSNEGSLVSSGVAVVGCREDRNAESWEGKAKETRMSCCFR